jgi:hypothetical protein
MKWLTQKSGDVRDRVVFAWKPKKCADGFTRRFVFLNVREEFKEYHYEGELTVPDVWVPVRYTPTKHDPEAEAEAAAMQLIRDARPKPPMLTFSFGGLFGGGIFGTPVEEGDEWKTPEPEEKNAEDDSDD